MKKRNNKLEDLILMTKIRLKKTKKKFNNKTRNFYSRILIMSNKTLNKVIKQFKFKNKHPKTL